MEVISVSEVYNDGVQVTHCRVIFSKKTFDVNGNRTLTISLPEEEQTIGFVFSSNLSKKSFIIKMDMSGLFLKDCYDDFNQLRRIISRTFSREATLELAMSVRSSICSFVRPFVCPFVRS